MNLSILDLGDDILVSQIPKYLTPEEIFNFSIINKSIYQLYYHSQLSSLLFQILYNKKFTNNENNYTLSLKDKLNWKQLFELRCNPKQKVYTWGSPSGGRLGYLISRVDQYRTRRINEGGHHQWSVNMPCNIHEFNDHIIVDIVANGYSFIILTNSGEMWFTGVDWKQPHHTTGATPGPIHQQDYRPNPGALALESLNNQNGRTLGSRRSLRLGGMRGVMPMPFTRHDPNEEGNQDEEEETTTATTPPHAPTGSPVPGSRRRLQPTESSEDEEVPEFYHPPSKIKETNFLSRLFLPPRNNWKSRKVISLSTGREHIIALDNFNHIYSWDTGCCTNIGIRIRFPGIPDDSFVVKIVAGWNLSCCLIVGIGLVVWYSREPLSQAQFERHEFESDAKYIVIPFTKDDIVDFTVGADCIIYIKRSDGKLYQFKFNAHDFATRNTPINPDEITNCIQPMSNFNNWKSNIEQQGAENVRFTKLNSCYTNFAVFTNHDHVLIGSRKHLVHYEEQRQNGEDEAEGRSPIIMDELQGKNIKTLEIGDYHYLALTNDGDILSWGRESSGCGCLGLGSEDDVVRDHPEEAVLDDYHSLQAIKPLKVKNPPYPGKWVSIAASGWHSGGIYVPIEDTV
ncbi:uncharacterized protein J8A68_006141 [[Candida] subhashii]|uniref:SCF-associated factor 1 n=1 Tax=[Candida] subhashii TaxID=561895 RepID=A0A8J5Q001_9ASCO|nr:uncharacterized protein J8A68_006141 [[Candida] subhashii]KAG7660344.1 hypothetical protein J8A68_006141 [[Candida] subhashii]